MSQANLQYTAFISYASADRAKAEEICASLENRGFRCWIAPRDVRAGREYGDEIIHGIQNSRCLVLVLSEAANESSFVRREVERAVSKKKPVFPVRIEEVLPSPSLELFVSSTHWIDAWSGRLVDHVDRLARDLSGGDAPAVTMPPRSESKRTPRWAVVSVAIVVLVAAIALVKQFALDGSSPTRRGQDDSTAATDRPLAKTQTPETEAPRPRPGENERDWFQQVLNQQHVDLAALGPTNLSVEVFQPARHSQDLALRIKTAPPALRTVLGYGTMSIALDREDFVECGMLTGEEVNHRRLNQTTLRKAETVGLKFIFPNNKVVGPFTYAVRPGDALRENFKQLALKQEQWFVADELFCSFQSLQKFFPAVKRIHFGESSNQLDRILAVQQPATMPDEETMKRIGRNYWLDCIPVRVGAAAIYAQLEFYDGSKSDIRPALMQRGSDFGACGFRAKPATAAGVMPPALFASFYPEKRQLTFAAEAPPQTEQVQYSFDAGGWLTARKFSPTQGPGNEHPAFAFLFEGPIADSVIRLQYQLKNAEVAGPFAFELKAIQRELLAAFKTRFVAFQADAVFALRVVPPRPVPWTNDPSLSEAANDESRRKALYAAGDAATEFRSAILSTLVANRAVSRGVTSEPALWCVPKERTLGASGAQLDNCLMNWATVSEVRLGIESGKLDQRSKVPTVIEDVISGRFGRDNSDATWRVRLPVETAALYAQYVFFDGTTTPEIRVPITEVQR